MPQESSSNGAKTRLKSIFRVKLGNTEFSDRKGDFLGRPYIKLSTNQHSQAKFIINDPDATIFAAIKKETDGEVVLGFADGEQVNKLIGKVFSFCRKPPDGTEVVLVDPSYQMQQAGSSSQFAGEIPSASTTTQPAGGAQNLAEVNQQLIDQLKQLVARAQNQPELATTQEFQTIMQNADHVDEGKRRILLTLITGSIGKPTNETNQRIEEIFAQIAPPSSDRTTQPGSAQEQQLQSGTQAPTESTTTTINGQQTTQPDTFRHLAQLVTESAKSASSGKTFVQPAQQLTAGFPELKFAAKTDQATDETGSVRVQQSAMQAAEKQAAAQGDVLVTRGNTVSQVGAGQGDPSGLVLDYARNPSAFIGTPSVTKRSGLQLQSGYGALTVMGYSVIDKGTVGATVLTPLQPGAHPTGVIQVPEWGDINLSDPIIPGGIYTWNDATKNGTRVPDKQIMERIIKIAQVIQPLTDQTVGKGKKWEINSWYRDRRANDACGGAPNSRHLYGDAVDAWFEGFMELHSQMEPSYSGGLAYRNDARGTFIHIDCGDRRRWTY